MTVLNEQESERIRDLASRLRLIQADSAMSPPDQRRERFSDEIGRSLESLSPKDRKRYLEALLDRFPVAGQILRSAMPAVPTSASESLPQLTERLRAAAAKLSAPERADLVNELAEAGLVRMDREAILVELADNLRRALGLTGHRQPSLARLVEMTVFLVDALCLLDQQALKTMRELSPGSPLLRRPEDFRSATARFLLGEIETLDPQWLAMRGLLGALLAALQGGGRDFARQCLAPLSPAAIEAVVAEEGSNAILGLGKSRKERCWEKYVALAKDFETSELTDRRLKEAFAAFVDKSVPALRSHPAGSSD